EVGLVGRQLAEVAVHLRGRLLEDRHPADHRLRHAVVADGEVVERALGLRAPVVLGRHLDGTHRVRLRAGGRDTRLATFAHVLRSRRLRRRAARATLTARRDTRLATFAHVPNVPRDLRTRRTVRSVVNRTYGSQSRAARASAAVWKSAVMTRW